MKNQKDSQRPTELELEERYFVTMRLRRMHLHKHEVKAGIRAFVNQQSGGFYAKRGKELSARTIETYIARADQMIAERSSNDFAAETNLSVSWYQSVIADPKTSTRDKLAARKRLDEIFGIGITSRMEHHVVSDPAPQLPSGALHALETVYGKKREEQKQKPDGGKS